jgi:hypothetical protein
MNNIINSLSCLNIVLGLFSFIPCVMVGAMSMDSPQAQHDPWAILISNTFLTFPLVSILSGILSLIIKPLAIYILPIPYIEILVFCFFLMS